jgi:hypothetical protein
LSKELEILQWLREVGAPSLGIKVTLNAEFSSFWKGACSARAFMKFRGKDMNSSGCGSSQEMAIVVAIAELIERCCLASYKGVAKTSNGFAVHSNWISCQRAATFEMLERDAYLCHHLTRTPFKEVELTIDLLNEAPTLHDLINSGVNVRAGQLNALGNGKSCVVVVDGSNYTPKFGVLLSSAYALDFKTALEKAARETMSSLAFRTIFKHWGTLSLDGFLNRPKVGPKEHGMYALYPDKEKWLNFFFDDYPSSLNTSAELPKIHVEEIELPRELLNPPLFACRATSDELQSLYFGMADSDVLNSERLSRFMGSRFELLNKVETFPHFLD